VQLATLGWTVDWTISPFPDGIVGVVEVAGQNPNQSSLEHSMEYFRLEHPPDRLILCHHPDCNDIADYLEVNEQGREGFACAAHTTSEKHVSVLPDGFSKAEPQRSRPAA